ncbi:MULTISPECIES: M1 family metallopeptidase [Dyadobacter]|uniref:M1 family metallopeptidase n=1 Tax=Dyadobacter chenhuakuii TaxID=2909339 RepID=A0ABY4XG27_9BACT|nr:MULTISPECIES: M1 family metallopeptidase [Dyadobacter]MCF2495330.1 M1 family metallopeptidase [Dyadobacter chenhuakuii]MCF2516088.1 M1 family metallopeptidase [Dyadobacter sp. CY351]USJ29369.1 M1 family metallopeptidase [Dyadobacter chenhuakuii]
MKRALLPLLILLITVSAMAQQLPPNPNYKANDRFEQLGTMLPTPNSTRAASGAPGREYWQNRADYDIKVELDDDKRKIIGSETITFFNNSPDDLKYIWLQLDQNLFKKDGIGATSRTGSVSEKGMSTAQLAALNNGRGSSLDPNVEYGYKIGSVKDKAGKVLPYTINGTMMRIDLPMTLKSGTSYVFGVDWTYNVTEYYGRSGYEFFPKDGNANYFIAHWFPRLAPYDDINGWNHKQFLGQGEFALIFGNYKVAITAPADHVVAASGECQNYAQVLTATQKQRLKQAETSKTPVLIVTQAEAEKAEKRENKNPGKKTWIYKADNVRDFAFASSRKFIWDAMQTDVYKSGRKIWCMSIYPKEGNPLWEQYSTRAVAHTLKSYGARTFEYPYPVAISCHGVAGGGMEYPMISFNGGRPEEDGTYSEAVKYGMIGVIIHEVGHNFFPMIVNSDERQWAWMDEGLNTFCQYLAEKEWDYNFPTRRGEPNQITDYMSSDKSVLTPIMASAENVIGLGPNAYAKPATALNILRETVMGRELFDHAFKEYATRWRFKSPSPADFFRTMEDASGVDLDWFWKGWFYGTEAVDQDLVSVDWFSIDTQNPEIEKEIARKEAARKQQTMSKMQDAKTKGETVVAQDSTMADFYNRYDPFKVTEADKQKYNQYLATLSDNEKALIQENSNFYTLSIKNKGGLPMPVIVKMGFEDGTDSVAVFPAEIWRFNDAKINKVISTKKKVVQWTLDPYQQIADIDTENNAFPRVAAPTRFQIFKQQQLKKTPNPMQMQGTGAGKVTTDPKN